MLIKKSVHIWEKKTKREIFDEVTFYCNKNKIFKLDRKNNFRKMIFYTISTLLKRITV
jgi:hypothetical protein